VQVSNHLHTVYVSVVVNKPTRAGVGLDRVNGYVYELAYRGLSGMTRDPAARMAPMTHWMNKGILQDQSDSMKDEK
jgi:hypothetical protein